MITDSTTAREMWPVDAEWVTLVLKAREIGLTIEEIRDFLQEAVNTDSVNPHSVNSQSDYE